MSRKSIFGLALCLALSSVYADAPAPAAAPAPVGPIPVETFFTYAKVSGAKISPDGKYLAMAIANEKTGLDKNILAVVSMSDMKVQAKINMLGDESIAGFWWANDERVLVAGAKRANGLDRPGGDGNLYAINVDGSKMRRLLPYMPSVEGGHMHTSVSSAVYFYGMIFVSADKGSDHIVFQGFVDEGARYRQQPKAFELDIYTGAIRQVATGSEDAGSLGTDNDGIVRVTWGPDVSGHAHIFYRPSGDTNDWKDLSSLLLQHEDPAEVESRPLGFAADNKQFYWLGRSKYSTLGLYLVDPEAMTMKPVFEDPDYDINTQDFGNFDPDGVVWQFGGGDGVGGTIVAVETMPGLPKLHVVAPDDLKSQYLVQLFQAFDGQQVEITSASRDHGLLVVHVTSDRNPGDFYIFDTKTNKANYLFSSKPDIDPDQMAEVLPVVVTARDGVVLHGYLTLPRGGTGKNLPLIVNPHGGPHGPRDQWLFDTEVQLFANRGYAVLQLNFRGSGGYGLNFQQLGYQHWSSTMQDDLADGVQWAIKQGYADPKRVCIYGASYGGYAAFENPIRYPDLYQCAVGYVGAYDLTLLGEKGDVAHFAGGTEAMNVWLGADMDERKRESPAYNADKLTIPVMIAYGGADVRVVPLHAKHMMAALDKAGKQYPDPIYYANEGHGFIEQKHNFDLYTQMLAFFDKYIGPDAAKTAPAAKP